LNAAAFLTLVPTTYGWDNVSGIAMFLKDTENSPDLRQIRRNTVSKR